LQVGIKRVHRNALVRLAAVREVLETDELVLPSGRLPIAKRRMEEIKRMLGIW
jgi:DNA-binding LytR/AlgR family response regulator